MQTSAQALSHNTLRAKDIYPGMFHGAAKWATLSPLFPSFLRPESRLGFESPVKSDSQERGTSIN
jgi:hypothetical protein